MPTPWMIRLCLFKFIFALVLRCSMICKYKYWLIDWTSLFCHFWQSTIKASTTIKHIYPTIMDHLNTTANMNLNKHNLIIPGVGITLWLVQTKLFRSTPAERKLVNIISWNINGLTPDKLSKNVLGSFLEDYDIILLCETWASEQNDFILEGFRYFNYPR